MPVLIRTQHAEDPVMRSLPTVLTVHNLGYQGVFPRDGAAATLNLPDSLFTFDGLEFWGKINFLKGGSCSPITSLP